MKKILSFLIALLIFTSNTIASANTNNSLNYNNIYLKAQSYNILPDNYIYTPESPITRFDFCQLLFTMLNTQSNKIVDYANSIYSTLAKYDEPYFYDTQDECIRKCAILGITQNLTNNKFAPNKNITRQVASSMLYNTAKIYKTCPETFDLFNKLYTNNKTIDFPYEFEDNTDIEKQYILAVQYCFNNKLINKTGNNFFPNKELSQYEALTAITTLYELFNAINKPYNTPYIALDNTSNLYGYMYNQTPIIPCIYNEAYRFYEDKAIIKISNIYKLIDKNGNIIVDNINTKNSFLSDNESFVYDCCGDMLIIATPIHSRNMSALKTTAYSYTVFDANGKFYGSFLNNINFTSDGSLVNFSEDEFKTPDSTTSFALFDRNTNLIKRTYFSDKNE